jgi:hypothetical protein
MLFKLLLDVKNVATERARGINTLPGLNLELSFLPIGDNFALEGILELELFVSRLGDLLNFFTELEERALEELLQSEGLALVRNLFLDKFDDVFPMAVADGGLCKGGNEGQDLSHVVDLLLELTVSLPGLEGAWQLATISGELINSFHHFINFVNNLCPGNLAPLGNSVLDFAVEGVQFVKQLNLIGSLHQERVLSVGETEQGLAGVVRVELALSDRVLVREHAQTVQSLTGFKARHSWTLSLKVVSEVLDINDQCLHSLDKVQLEVGVLALKFVADVFGTANKRLPVVLHGGLGVHLILVHDVAEVGVNQRVHVVDGLELEGNLGLLLSDLLECFHYTAKRVIVLHGLVNLELDLLDLVGQVFEQSLGLLVEVTRVSVFPGVDPALKATLNVVSLKRKSTDLVLVLDVHDRLQDAVEVLELFFEVLELRVVLIEELESLVSALLP